MKTLCAGLVALGASCVAHAQCGESTYFLAPEQMTWQDGQAYAHSVGGYLVCIGSAEEQAYVEKVIGLSSAFYWLGFTDEKTEGVWKWVSGEPVVYTGWAGGSPGESRGSPYGPEDYARACINCDGWEDFPSPTYYYPGGGSFTAVEWVVVEIPGAHPDLNDDGHVNAQDLALVLGFWGDCSGVCPGDANCDGTVDGLDIGIVLGAWG